MGRIVEVVEKEGMRLMPVNSSCSKVRIARQASTLLMLLVDTVVKDEDDAGGGFMGFGTELTDRDGRRELRSLDWTCSHGHRRRFFPCRQHIFIRSTLFIWGVISYLGFFYGPGVLSGLNFMAVIRRNGLVFVTCR